MEHRRQHSNGFSYSNLFNLESLVNFQVPQPDDAHDDYENSSQDESRSSQGEGAMLDSCNGSITNRSSDVTKRRKTHVVEPEALLSSSTRKDTDSSDEGDENYGTRISEDQYRSMLTEHIQKYRRVRFKDSSSGLASTRTAVPYPKRTHGTKVSKFSNEPLVSVKEEAMLHEKEASPEYNGRELDAEYVRSSRLASSVDSAYLDIGEGITYRIPPTYDKLATHLKLPSFFDIHVEEHFLNGSLDLRSLAAMVAVDQRTETRNRGGLCEPQSQYDSLQARLKAVSAASSDQKFTLQICDIGLDPSSIPEGAAGRIRRSIISESGTLQVYFVKVLEKGDTYEIIERSLPKKQVVKKDPSVIEKEEMEKMGKVWMSIARRDIPKHHRIFMNFHKKQLADAKRCSETCQREVKLKVSRSFKLMRGAAIRTRKLARDMLIFWKRVDKEQAELRKKEERDAAEALKREEELREARRQQQRLNFLLSQTELYSHFMQNKPTSQSAEDILSADGEAKGPEEGSTIADVKPGEEEDPEEAKLRREALRAAQHAVSQQKMKTSEFDNECLKLRQDAESSFPANDSAISGSTNIDLLNPSTMPVTSSVQTPEMFKGKLKEYQLKGLQWLVNCYEQGLNGILADEMGLGKTIQAMAFLAHLAEEKNIWGPFLVVAPSSVLNNWADEVSRFCPELKTLPYWGGTQERTVLRKNINPKRLYRRESRFHILITSYQLLVTDEKYLRRVKWQYMVLDEAQAIKSSNSIRWKTLLSFNCRNRLLLTGTPIQNNMAELWALLHFIMPTLFDSHEQFSEWFAKGIESHAEHGGTLNEHQLNRLHAVLKPFMLRRVKKDVISEMTGKTEVTVHCKLSSRQQAFYQAIKNKISLAELLDGSRGHLNEKKIVNLMNIVIQLRKVCNHPELFERNEGRSYLYFANVPNSLLPPPFGEPEDVYYAGDQNPITYKLPKLIHQEIIRESDLPCSLVGHGVQRGSFERLLNVFSPYNVYQSSFGQSRCSDESRLTSGVFGFTRLVELSPVEVSFLANCSLLQRLLFSVMRGSRQFVDEIVDLFLDSEDEDLQFNHLDKGRVRAVKKMLLLPTKSESSFLRSKLATGPGDAPFEALAISHQDRFLSNIRLLRAIYAYIPRSRAPPINVQCPDRSFSYQMVEELHHPWTKKLLLGLSRTSEFNGPRKPVDPHYLIQEIHTDLVTPQPILEMPYWIFGSSPPVRSFDPAKMLTDSGKLQTLDILLKRLRAQNHRVLLFAQMTKMLNILEDYMNYRKYKYFRLDGSSTIMDRRDMVRDFQRRNDIFVFLLSTRAGGLGINLTAADTVIFYESDWNPTLDLQAMDRAHRLGQTKEVTVYRLICKETVEEKILQRASQKNTVQQLVMTGKHVQGDLLKPEDVVSLLLDDAQLEQKLREREIPVQAKDRQKRKRVTKGIRVDAEGDVTLEDLTNPNSEAAVQEDAANKKRKSSSEKKVLKPQGSQKMDKISDLPTETNETSPIGSEEDHMIQEKPKRIKKSTKSINEDIGPLLGSAASIPAGNSDENHLSFTTEL
ncbi:chromatin-remodeling ATPase INO80 isoform X1 [Typha angustifolia]|uniref:chromatin-remodeling ATPase INO80 isoform X1 n=1 Tax=Typha angustifolia TaxID=59011 RepID=UPI003C2ABC06